VGILHGWKYCPRCRTELAGDEKRVECPECGFVAYSNPVPTATAVCVDDEGRVLLGRRALEPDKGLWDLPGGFVDEAEHPLDAVKRELVEEAGLEIEPVEFLGVWMDRYGYDSTAASTFNLYWERASCPARSGRPTTWRSSAGSRPRISPGTSSRSSATGRS
jgi:hypothetical protein